MEFLWQPKFYVWKQEATKESLPSLPEISKVRSGQAHKKPLENLWNKLNTTTKPISTREHSNLDIFKKIKEPIQQFEVQRREAGDRRVYKRIDYR